MAVYNKIMEHLNGQRGRDADVAREAFQDYKMNESLTSKQERSKFCLKERFLRLLNMLSVQKYPKLTRCTSCQED